MGYFFDSEAHHIEPKTICTLRRLPICDGAVYRIIERGRDFEVYRMPCKASMRRMYKSGRVIVIYSLSTMLDGVYEACTIGKDGTKCRHRFELLRGQIQVELPQTISIEEPK